MDTSTSPNVVIAGYNIYAPTLLPPTSGNPAVMIFGGWLSEADKPHDSIYRCIYDDLDGCSHPRRIATVNDLPVAASHLNDPTILCEKNTDICTYGATVCRENCKNQRDNQIWVGRGPWHSMFKKLAPLIVDGAAEPAIGLGSGTKNFRVPVVYFTRRGNPSSILMQSVDWQSLRPIESPTTIMEDIGDYAVSGVAFLEIGERQLLVDRI